MRKGLILDDERTIRQVFVQAKSYHADLIGLVDWWDVTHDIYEFQHYIQNNDLPDFITFDHDLGANNLSYDDRTENGLACVKWLVDYLEVTKQRMPLWFVHSANVVGKKNIECFIDSALRSGYIEGNSMKVVY